MNKPPHKPKKFYRSDKPRTPRPEGEAGVAAVKTENRPAQNPQRERQNRPPHQTGAENQQRNRQPQQQAAVQEAQEPRYPRISNEEAFSLFENTEPIRKVNTYNELAIAEVERLRTENLMLFEQIKEAQTEAGYKVKKILTLSSEEEPEIYKQKVKQLTDSFEAYLQSEKEREGIDENVLSTAEDDDHE